MTDLRSPRTALAAGRGTIDRLDSETFVADPIRMTPPRLHTGVIERPGVTQRLGRLADRPLLLVVAPTGSGKTVALVQWTQTQDRPTAWLTLDELDNDPVYFVRHLALALDQLHPLPDAVFEPLSRAVPPLASVVLPRLGRELASWDASILVVLDDVHLVRSPETLRCIQGLLAYLPTGSTLVSSGRSPLALGLGRLRIQHLVNEVGPQELAMDSDGARDLFAAADVELDPSELARLLEHTEGWPVGLTLAVMARQSGAENQPAFGGAHRLVAEYVRSEVLNTFDDDLARFLVQCSVLPTLSGPLCDEVLGTTGSAERLEALASSDHLFVVPLDDERRSYRLQHLFAEALRAELHATDPELERTLHRRAAAVHERDGNPDGAIRHAHAAGDVEHAGDLTLAYAVPYGMRGRNATVGLWLDLVDDAVAAQHASLSLAVAWYRIGTSDPHVADHWSNLAQRAAKDLPADRRAGLEALIALYRAIVCVEGVGHMAKYTSVVRNAGPQDNQWWGVATMLEGVADVLMGEVDRGAELIEQAAVATGHQPATQSVAYAQLAAIALRQDDLATATRLADRSIEIMEQHQLEEYTPIVPVFGIAALVRARSGRPDDARRLGQGGRHLLGALGHLAPRARFQACVTLAEVDLLLGDRDAARTMLVEASDAATREPEAHLLHTDLERIRRALDDVQRPDRPLPIGPSTITTAELRVLELMPTHLSLGEIAEQLYVSRNTVKSHAISTYRKLGVSSRSGAVAAARELGLIEG